MFKDGSSCHIEKGKIQVYTSRCYWWQNFNPNIVGKVGARLKVTQTQPPKLWSFDACRSEQSFLPPDHWFLISSRTSDRHLWLSFLLSSTRHRCHTRWMEMNDPAKCSRFSAPQISVALKHLTTKWREMHNLSAALELRETVWNHRKNSFSSTWISKNHFLFEHEENAHGLQWQLRVKKFPVWQSCTHESLSTKNSFLWSLSCIAIFLVWRSSVRVLTYLNTSYSTQWYLIQSRFIRCCLVRAETNCIGRFARGHHLGPAQPGGHSCLPRTIPFRVFLSIQFRKHTRLIACESWYDLSNWHTFKSKWNEW